MSLKVKGWKELQNDIQEMIEILEDESLITKDVQSGMSKYAHRDTGFLAGSFERKKNVVISKAPYAEYEALRGGSHDFVTKGIDNFNINKYADRVVEPF